MDTNIDDHIVLELIKQKPTHQKMKYEIHQNWYKIDVTICIPKMRYDLPPEVAMNITL